MKILVVSDTHGDLSSLKAVLLRHYDADIFLHAGDVGLGKNEISPFAAVKGNCDGYYEGYPKDYKAKTSAGFLYMKHYPLSSESEAAELYSEGVRIFIHGHTHEREDKMVGGIRVLCPGSLAFPRDDDNGTYLLLTIDGDKVAAAFMEI